MSDTPELKPCPFCGTGERRLLRGHDTFAPAVICGCGCDLNGQTDASVVAAWNTRAAPAVKPLVWKNWFRHGACDDGCVQAGAEAVHPILGTYRILTYKGRTKSRVFIGLEFIFEGDYTDCKPFAEKHAERRILEALQ